MAIKETAALCSKDRIIVAVDVPTLKEARLIGEQLASHVGGFKIGLELITSEGGPQVVREFARLNTPIMYDGKFHDIPATMAGAAVAVAKLNVWGFTVHASAGPASLKAAMEQKGHSLGLAVTVLTSHNETECVSIFGAKPDEKVWQFVQMAQDSGADGIVCSGAELRYLRDRGYTGITVIPAVRPDWAAVGDQKRPTTPTQIMTDGGDFMVIGRPITKPPSATIGNSIEAARLITEEIREARKDYSRFHPAR